MKMRDSLFVNYRSELFKIVRKRARAALTAQGHEDPIHTRYADIDKFLADETTELDPAGLKKLTEISFGRKTGGAVVSANAAEYLEPLLEKYPILQSSVIMIQNVVFTWSLLSYLHMSVLSCVLSTAVLVYFAWKPMIINTRAFRAIKMAA